MSFIEEFKPALSGLLTAPYFIYNFMSPRSHGLEKPQSGGVKELALFSGHSYDAYRAQLSRSRRKGEVILEKDGRNSYIVPNRSYQNLSQFYTTRGDSEVDYTLILFSFATGESKERYRLKELLKNLKFVMVNQNGYIGYGVNREALIDLLFKEGFRNNTQVFSGITKLEGITEEILLENLNLAHWKERIKRFENLSHRYLDKYPIGNRKRLLAIIQVSTSLYTNILIDSPKLPHSMFPEGSVIMELDRYLLNLLVDEWKELKKDYKHYFCLSN